MQVLDFAWMRERIGVPKEEVETSAATVAELVEELKAQDARHGAAFADMASVRVAVDQELTGLSASLEGVREVAFFPPMTGG